MSLVYPSLLFDAQGNHSENLFGVELPVLGGASASSPALMGGAKTFNGLVSEPELDFVGSHLNGVNWTFYNRVIVEPARIDVGSLITVVTRAVLIWNGFLENKTLSNFQRINDAGIDVVAPNDVPYDLRPLEVATYLFVIGTDGPAAINAEYIWTVEGEDYSATIEGARAFVFPFPPNFASPLQETLEWRTNVLRAYSGKEQRRNIRSIARRNFQYQFWLGREAQQLLQNSLLGWQNRVFALPVWMDKVLLTSALSPGDTAIPINTDGYSFTAGSALIILKNEQEYEVLDIDTIGSSISLVAGVQQEWPAGTPVYPVIAAHLPVSVSTQQLTDTVISGTAQFTPSPGVTDPYLPDTAVPVAYQGVEVITVQPNWGSGVGKEFNYAFDTVDNGIGPITWAPSESFARIIRRYSWLLKSRAEIAEFRAFLGRRQGRFKTCWIPSWSYDFEVLADVTAGDLSLVTKDNGFFDFIGVNPAFAHLMVRLKVNANTAGQIFYRQITGLSRDPETREVTIAFDAAFGLEFLATDILSIHYLFKSRLDTDRVLLEWQANDVAIVNTNFITVLE